MFTATFAGDSKIRSPNLELQKQTTATFVANMQTVEYQGIKMWIKPDVWYSTFDTFSKKKGQSVF